MKRIKNKINTTKILKNNSKSKVTKKVDAKIDKNKPLTKKQELFVQEYVVDFNGTAAAIRAGYSKKTATLIATQNVRKPNIKFRIDAVLEARAAVNAITVNRILEEYGKLAFMDPRKFFKEDGSVLDVTELDDSSAACVAGMDISVVKKEGTTTEYIKKIRLTDKSKALKDLATYLHMFAEKDDSGKEDNYAEVLKELAKRLPV